MCSMWLASSQAASVQGYSKFTLSGFYHNFYKAHPFDQMWVDLHRNCTEKLLFDRASCPCSEVMEVYWVFQQESCSCVCSLETAQLIQLKLVF